MKIKYFIQLKFFNIKINQQQMNNRMMLPIQLTKILYQSWEGQISTSSQDSQIYGKCLNGPGKVIFKNGNRYEGEFYNGLLNGKGKFIWANGIVYDGEFTDNRITGKGIYKWPDGSSYQGQVKDGLRHGNGKYTIDDATYEGQWIQGKKEGKGKIIFKSGSIFEGSFKNDMKEGYGKMYYYPSGNYFEGEWKQDVKSGLGTMNWTDIRQKYVGNWKNNQQQGWGMHIWLQSKGEGKYLRNRYEGNWKNGVRDGFGIFYYANGSKYEGYWKQNMKEGYSFYTDQNGKNSLILFNKDRMIKNDKPTQLQNQQAKKLPNKKQVQPNYYSLCLNIDHFYLPFVPNLQFLYNYLLRNNTQLKNWYKGASSFYDQQSQLSFSLNLEGTWKMIRSLKVLGQFSLAQFNRGLPQLNPDIQALLKIIPQEAEQKVHYQDLYYRYLGEEAQKQADWKALKDSTMSVNEHKPFKQYIVHNRESNILFRQFVHLLVWMAHQLDYNIEKPQKSIQKLITKIAPFLQTITKSLKSSVSENLSQNKSSISKAQKTLTPFYRNVNTQIFKLLLNTQIKSISKSDQTIKIRQLLGYGAINGCIGENQWVLLQKILQKYFDNDIIGQPKNPDYIKSQIPTKILNVLNYELIQFQFIEVIYILFIKKLPSTKENEQNKKKYLEVIQDLAKTKQQYTRMKQNESEFKNEIRYIQSEKNILKKRLEQKRRVMEQKKYIMEAKKREGDQEEIERQLMKRQDIDIKDIDFQEEQSQFQI